MADDLTARRRNDIVFSHRFFPPGGQPYGLMLQHIAGNAAGAGLKAGVFSGLEAGLETAARDVDVALTERGIEVVRIGLALEERRTPVRIRNAIRYVTGLYRHIRATRPGIVTAASFPPVLPALAAGLAARAVNAKFIYHVQDIHPEISAPKMRTPIRQVYRWVFGPLDRLNLRLASAIVTLSEDMSHELQRRGADSAKIHLINNYALTDITSTAPPELDAVQAATLQRVARFRLLFAGNMGAYQSLDELAPLLDGLLSASDTEILFIGEGVKKKWLKERYARNPRVRFLDQMPFAVLRRFLDESDMGIVSLDEQSWRYAYPSKLVTYLGAGLPVLCMVNPDSDFFKLIARENLGVTVDPRDPMAALPALMNVAKAGTLSPAARSEIRNAYSRGFDRDVLDRKWIGLLSMLRGENPSAD